MPAADPRDSAPGDQPRRSAAETAIVGLRAEAAACTVAAYFAAFRWDATLDPTTMSAQAFLGATLAPGARRG